MLEGPFHFHLGLLVLGFLQTKDPGQMCCLFNAVWASSGLAQTAEPASSLDSWPVGFPFHSLLNYGLYYSPRIQSELLGLAFKASHAPIPAHPSLPATLYFPACGTTNP